MNVSEAIKKVLDNENTTQTELCKKMNIPKTTLNTALRNGNITINKLLNIMNELGYEIVLRPKNGTNKVERSVTIDEKVGD